MFHLWNFVKKNPHITHIHFPLASRMVQEEVKSQLPERGVQVFYWGEFVQRVVVSVSCFLQARLPKQDVPIFKEFVE